jgi:hypothetical protein
MVSEFPLNNWQVPAWVFPPGSTPSPSQIAQADNDDPGVVNRYLYNDGGYASSTYSQLIVENQCLSDATVTSISVVKACQPAIAATIFVGQAQLSNSGSAEGTQLGFNLDSSDPEAMDASGWDMNDWTQPYDTGPLVSIPGGKAYVFDIKASALHVACKFWIRMRVVANGEVYCRTFSDGGQPFRVSALLPGVLESDKHPFAGYGQLYVGAAASPWHNDSWVRENPETWQ